MGIKESSFVRWIHNIGSRKDKPLPPGAAKQHGALSHAGRRASGQVIPKKTPNEGTVDLLAQNSAAVASNSKVNVHASQPDDAPLSEPFLQDAYGSRCWESAYKAALRDFPEADVKNIMSTQGMGELIFKLKDEKDERFGKSLIQKGLEKLKKPLEYVSFLKPLGNAISGVDPAVSTAVGILSAFLTVAVAACGAAPTIENNIVQMFQNVPVIDVCDQISKTQETHKLLVKVYTELIRFYLEASKLFTKHGLSARITIGQLTGNLERSTDSFNITFSQLKELASLESIIIVQATGNMMLDSRVQARLDQRISQSRNATQRKNQANRSDEACNWIFKDPSFLDWLSAPCSKFLVLKARMGFGKSIVTSRVIDVLAEKAESENPRPFVLYHYCQDEKEIGSLVNIYSSLMSQLLEKRVDLRQPFLDWDTLRKKDSTVDPVMSPSELGAFLTKHLQRIGRTLYIVLDGLDECNDLIIEPLVDFLRQLHQGLPELKVMFSSRPEEDVLRHLKIRMEVTLPPLTLRDSMIVKHHIRRRLPNLDPELQTFLLNELASQSHGSAKYIELVIENIRLAKTTNKETIQDFLANYTYEWVSKLYLELFTSVTGGNARARRCLSRALEIIATVRRPINVTELAHAIALSEVSKDCSKLSDVIGKVDIAQVQKLIAPFAPIDQGEDVAKAEADSPNLTGIQLHLSLIQQVVHEQPLKWTIDSVKDYDGSDEMKQDHNSKRKKELDGQLLGLCSKYLLLDEFGEKNLLSDEFMGLEEVMDSLPSCGADYFNNEVESDTAEPTGDDVEICFNPADLGFGKFFTYAACYWLSHLGSAELDSLPSIEDLVKLSARNSKRRKNWVDQYCRPDCTRGEKVPMPYPDPLAIVACLAPASLTKKMLDECDLNDRAVFVQDSIETAQNLMLRFGKLATCKSLSSDLKAQDPTFFFNAVREYHAYHNNPGLGGESNPPLKPEDWKKIFELVDGAVDNLVKKKKGIELLCYAAQRGCMPMISALFKAAAKNASLEAEILRDVETKSSEHLSVGLAIREHHLEVVEFLLEKREKHKLDIGKHLHHRNSLGHNVFHMAARSGCSPEIVKLLLKRFKEGANAIDDDCGATPMSHYAYEIATFSRLKSARLLVKVGEVDLVGRCTNPSHEPLRVAVTKYNDSWCHFLVEECGADPRSVLTSDSNGNTRFIDKLLGSACSEEESKAWERNMLNYMCTAAKIDVEKGSEVVDRLEKGGTAASA